MGVSGRNYEGKMKNASTMTKAERFAIMQELCAEFKVKVPKRTAKLVKAIKLTRDQITRIEAGMAEHGKVVVWQGKSNFTVISLASFDKKAKTITAAQPRHRVGEALDKAVREAFDTRSAGS